MYIVEEAVSKRFLEKKIMYESLNVAVRLVTKQMGSTGSIAELIGMKSKAKKDYFEEVQSLSNSYFSNCVGGKPVNSNMLQLLDGWYGVAYYNDKKSIDLKFELLIERDIYMLERTGNIHHFRKNDIETAIVAYIDESSLELYKHSLIQRALEFIHDYDPEFKYEEVPITSNPVSNFPRPSSHSSKRWVQRIVNIPNEVEAEDYRRNHLKEVDCSIEEGFSKASKLWEGSDGISYWFDDNNLMYVVGNNVIITLYEEDFGFTKGINKSIVLLQIEEIKKSYEELGLMEREHEEASREVDKELSGVESQLIELQASMSYLNSCKAALLATKDKSTKGIKMKREQFNNQFNKLFKK